MPRKFRSTCPAELYAPVHRRAKRAAVLEDKSLVDLVSNATDRCARRILKKHHVLVDDETAVKACGK
jgi:hypothetical protein